LDKWNNIDRDEAEGKMLGRFGDFLLMNQAGERKRTLKRVVALQTS